MPTYEYECTVCGLQFEKQQNMKDEPLRICPECGAPVQRRISGGTGFIFKSSGAARRDSNKACSIRRQENCWALIGAVRMRLVESEQHA